MTSLNQCYGCGKDNPIGLHLQNTYFGEKSQMKFEVRNEYCGYPGLMHGGITGILFDEVMFYAIARLGIQAVTLNINIDYKKPALAGNILISEAWIEKKDDKKIDVAAIITDSESGRIIAECKGRFLEVDLEKVLKG